MGKQGENSKATVKNQQNMAQLVEKSIKDRIEHSSGDDPAWKDVPNTPAITIWRINNFKLELIDKAKNGVFYEGDSYIVLHSFLTKSQKIGYDVFIWIGKASTPDEYGTAAFKMAELDVVVLGDAAVQHREIQSNESQKFLSLFEKMTILKGGCSSGFKKVDQGPPEPRLFHICGEKKNVKITQISCRKNNLTEDDVYILDTGNVIYQINGATSNKDERAKGARALMELKSENGKAKSEIIDDFTLSTKHQAIDALPVKEKSTLTKQAHQTRERSLWKVSDETGEIKMTKLPADAVKKTSLDTKDVFIFDSGDTVYVWVGKGTTRTEKMVSMSFGQKYAESINQPNISLIRIGEGAETEEFISKLK